jgi:DNA-binding response OmpR family regulator
MPKMNRFEQYREIRKINSKVKVCIITAYDVYYEQLKEEYPSLNIGMFIKKPIEIQDLINRLKQELQLIVLVIVATAVATIKIIFGC